VLWLPAKDEIDALAARWLAHTLESAGVQSMVASARTLSTENVERVNAEAPDVVCISVLSAGSKALARNLCKRLAIAEGSHELTSCFTIQKVKMSVAQQGSSGTARPTRLLAPGDPQASQTET
jgi:hypothetical protein